MQPYISDVCVIGRTNFATGIGSIAYAACELLSRYFSVSLYPVHSGKVKEATVVLPSGRRIPIARSPRRSSVVFFADVLWNGESDTNYQLVPEGAYRIAHLAYDSDSLPPEWVKVLNDRFDAVYFSSEHLIEVAQSSGVVIPVGWLPIALDLAPLLCAPLSARTQGPVTIGSVASFHPRKGTDTLARAFVEEFGSDPNARLVLHSNLAFGDFVSYIEEIVASSGVSNVVLSRSSLSRGELVAMERSFDIFANASMGEGYSIGPREALALGKSLVVSDIGAHADVLGVDGVFPIPATIRRPARYPEIDGRIFGSQMAVSVEDTRKALRAAFAHHVEGRAARDAVRQRRRRAAEFSFERLATTYARIVEPDVVRYRVDEKPYAFASIAEPAQREARARSGLFGAYFRSKNRLVVPAHDGSILDVLNAFMDSLADSPHRHDRGLVLPDWNVERVFGDDAARLRYFRYRAAGDQNIWNTIFEPLYGLAAGSLDSKSFLYGHATRAERRPRRDVPEVTVPSPGGYAPVESVRLRRAYHAQWLRYVRLRPERRAELYALAPAPGDGPLIGVAVGRPPTGGTVEGRVRELVRGWCRANGIADDWRPRIVLDEQSGWLADDLRSWGEIALSLDDHVAPALPFAEADPDADWDADWPTMREFPPLSLEHAWVQIRNALVLSHCRAVICRPSDLATAISYLNPQATLVDVGRNGGCE